MTDISSNLITILVPTVNRLAYLRESIQSVLDQSFESWEILIGENSGDPAYSRAVDSLATEFADSRIKVLHNVTQLSMIENSNSLYHAADCPFVLYLPDDDRLRPGFLERFASTLASMEGLDIFFCDFWVIDAAGRVDRAKSDEFTARYERDRLYSGVVPQNRLFGLALSQAFPLQAMITRRQALGESPMLEDKSEISDWDLVLRLVMDPPSCPLQVVYCSERFVEYRLHSGQATTVGGRDTREAYHSQLLDTLLGQRQISPADRKLWRRRLAIEYLSLAAIRADSGNWASWLRLWSKGVTADPWYGKGYLAMFRPLLTKKTVDIVRKFSTARRKARHVGN